MIRANPRLIVINLLIAAGRRRRRYRQDRAPLQFDVLASLHDDRTRTGATADDRTDRRTFPAAEDRSYQRTGTSPDTGCIDFASRSG